MRADPNNVLTGSHYLDGNHACAEGAIAAGCRFFAGYPITPSTEIAERVSRRFPLVGGNNMWGVGGSGFINTYGGLVIPYIAGSFGVFLCRQFYLSFPKSLDDAALIDGCSRYGIFHKIYRIIFILHGI